MHDIQRSNSLVAGIAHAKHLYAPWHGNRCHIEKVLNFPETSMSIHVKECCLQLQGRPMDDIQRPSSLVAGIASAKHLYAPWRGNHCHIEKVLNFPETSMSIRVKSVVYSSKGGPWMIFRGQVPWLQK
jgi:uncharacterized protein YlzI (FlbEa/FlbD family)